MTIINRILSAFIGTFRGEQARQKFIYLQQTKKDEQRLRNFWQKSGLQPLDEIELQSWHSN